MAATSHSHVTHSVTWSSGAVRWRPKAALEVHMILGSSWPLSLNTVKSIDPLKVPLKEPLKDSSSALCCHPRSVQDGFSPWRILSPMIPDSVGDAGFRRLGFRHLGLSV